jgi:AraC-like DNA-binding protein
MDPLSDVLSLLTVSSALSSRFEGRGLWAFRFPKYSSQVKFGGVLAGRMRLSIEGAGDPLVLQAGDFYLLAHGRPFRTASDPAPRLTEDGPQAYRAHRGQDGVVRYGDDGELVSLAAGRFTFEGEAGELLLRHLPPFIRLRASDPDSGALVSLLDLMRRETSDARAGAWAAKSSLATLVLVQALRAHLDRSPRPEGWLGAMTDPRIGAALSAMHGELARRWTVESLARVAAMSRTAFATRFRQLVGTTPLDYLVNWRMTVARSALRKSDDSIADIAERSGYLSDTAFSAAFKRATGQSPGRYRSLHAAAAPPVA